MTAHGAPSILVLGAGSIGMRHATNLAALGARVTITDPDPARNPLAEHLAWVDFDLDAIDGFDGVVVASPSAHHLEQALSAARTGAGVLVEKPLAASSAGVEELLAVAGERLMVGYNLRLHAPVEEMVGLAHGGSLGEVTAVRLWFGSWLPDWRPTADYRLGYSARADLGGGILHDAIHELDLAIWLRGPDLQVRGAVVARLGPLEIDVEDTVRALLVDAAGVPVTIELDYLSRRYRRGIEIVGTEATARLDWSRGVIEVETAAERTEHAASVPVGRSYEREAEVFLGLLRGAATAPVDGATGLASVRLAEQIRAAAR